MKNIEYFKEENDVYYTVHFDFGDIFIPLDPKYYSQKLQDEINEIKWWCYNNFGPGLGEYRIENSPFIHRWINDIDNNEIKFSNKQDLDWFLLKWN